MMWSVGMDLGGNFARKVCGRGHRRGRSLILAAGCSSGSSGDGGSSSGGSTNASTASSLSAAGGMSKLVAAAKKEGTLNVITLPADWANYGTIMKDFAAKYGIKINDESRCRRPAGPYKVASWSNRVVGLPAGLRGRPGRQGAQDRDPLDRAATLVSGKTVNQSALKALPPAPSTTLSFPSIAQQNKAETVVSQQWPSVSG